MMDIDTCHTGDCRDIMRCMIADGLRVQTIVTSPPYWGLRDYGVSGQLGLESLHDCLGWATGKLSVLRAPIRVVSVRREPLRAMLDDIEYGFAECEREGFGSHPDYRWPSAFVDFFCATHKACMPDTVVTRIEFTYETSKKGARLDFY